MILNKLLKIAVFVCVISTIICHMSNEEINEKVKLQNLYYGSTIRLKNLGSERLYIYKYSK